MNITVNLVATDLSEAIKALASALVTRTPVEIPQPAQPVRSSRAAKTTKTETAAAEVIPETAAEIIHETVVETEKYYTLEQVREKLVGLSQTGKQLEVKELIASFGVQKLTDIPNEKYAEVMSKAESLGSV